MSRCDLTIATGGPAMVKAAYCSGKPAYGVGAGNATMVIDETADIEEAARNTRISKTNDHGSGCSADGNLLVDAIDLRRDAGAAAAGRRVSRQRATRRRCSSGLLGCRGAPHARHDRARGRDRRCQGRLHDSRRQDVLHGRGAHIGSQHRFSTEKLGIVLAVFKYQGFDTALDMVRQIFETGGKGHSCGIYSFDDDHIHRLALIAPVSRIMVRQVQSPRMPARSRTACR